MTVSVPASKPIHEAHRIAEDGAVDADGHILEPPDLWETYIDPAFRDRALRIVVDENGLEELEIDGQRSQMSRRGLPSTLGAMGAPDLAAMMKDPERTYLREAPYGSMHPRVFAAPLRPSKHSGESSPRVERARTSRSWHSDGVQHSDDVNV